MESLVCMLEEKMLKNRFIGIFGSYAWSKGAVKRLQDFASQGNLTLVEPVVEFKCSPTSEDLKKAAELGKNMAARIKSK
ncbi:FprA family A-type flavoprotein, partial [Candidatus Sumerlaeota bacterium]|nr:FprA family A-type flavoprotein [Candidatus Sumerlaeota bacterium]